MPFFKFNKKNPKDLKKLYPDIIQAGTLSGALNIAFFEMGSFIRASLEDPFGKVSLYDSQVRHGKKFSQIYIAIEERLFLFHFWREGVYLARGKTDNIKMVAESIHYWLTTNDKTDMLSSKYTFVTLNERASAFDENKQVEFTWNLILNDPNTLDLKEFVKLAMEDEILSKLFPYTSMWSLCFSRCTGFPYSRDTPKVIPDGRGKYSVQLEDDTIIGTGSALEAINMVKSNLPKNIKPAIKGTAEDLGSLD